MIIFGIDPGVSGAICALKKGKIIDYTIFLGIVYILQVNKMLSDYDVINGNADIDWLYSKKRELVDICEAYSNSKQYIVHWLY